MFRELGSLIGSFVGAVTGVPIAIMAEMLGATEEMIKEAIKAGCETKEEIRKFLNDNY